MCRFIISVNRTITLLHNWLVASLAVTRCYAIYKPINSTTNYSSKFYYRLNLIVLFVLTFIFASLNIFGVMLLSYSKPVINNDILNDSTSHQNQTMLYSNQPICQVSQEIYDKYIYIDVYINITLGILGYSLPCFITLITNLMLIYNIKKVYILKKVVEKNIHKNHAASHDLPKNYGLTNIQSEKNSNKNRNQFFKTTSSLLLISISYLVCYIPYSFLFLFLSLDKITMDIPIIIFSFTCLKYLNHTLNFYIYFATGKKFRNDVLKIFKKKKKVLQRKQNLIRV